MTIVTINQLNRFISAINSVYFVKRTCPVQSSMELLSIPPASFGKRRVVKPVPVGSMIPKNSAYFSMVHFFFEKKNLLILLALKEKKKKN